MEEKKEKILNLLRSKDREMVLLGLTLVEHNYPETEWPSILKEAFGKTIDNRIILFPNCEWKIKDGHIVLEHDSFHWTIPYPGPYITELSK